MQLWKVKTNKKDVDIDENGYLKSFGKVYQYPRGEAIKKAKMFNGCIVKGIISEQGRCPKCQNEIIDYNDSQCEDYMFWYQYECPSCGFEGKEWFELSFQHHSTNLDEEIY